MAYLEHANITVDDPQATAALMQALFGWRIRWQGPGASGHTVHVGTETSYLALYAPEARTEAPAARYDRTGALNHIGIVVEDIAAVEEKVIAAGYAPCNHGNYEPGRRFYFDGPDGVEYEVVSYA